MTNAPVLDPRDPDPAARECLLGWLALQDVGALRPGAAGQALERTGGDPARAARAVRGAPAPAERAVLVARLDALASIGAVALPLGSPLYPPRLARLPDAAPLLCVRGDPTALSAPAVSIVGARAGSRRGREVARGLAADLAVLGIAVVSGLARGVDGAAHRGALAAGGLSVAVLACGLDQMYPPEHAALAAELTRRGAVVGELPPGTPPLPYHFPLRNRLIAGLASVVVVVEARERSGSLTTAAHARDQGTTLLVVPGPVDSDVCRGSNLLMRDGVHACLDVDDVLGALGLPPPAYVKSDPLAGVESRSQREVLRSLLDEAAGPDELARRLGRSAESVAVDLVNLELAGRLVRDRDGRLQARRRPGLS